MSSRLWPVPEKISIAGPLTSYSSTNVVEMRPAHFQISFADLELKQQGVELDPVLAEIADFIDEHEELVEAVRRDLDRGLKKPTTGRKGLTPRQVLGSMILMRVIFRRNLLLWPGRRTTKRS